jgi:hypothetical protein
MIHAPAAIRAITVPGLHKPLSVEMMAIGVAAVLLVILLVRRIIQGRNFKKRKAASGSHYDADVAHDGTGPAGFSGATSEHSAGPTPLAPSFGASASGGGSITADPLVTNAIPPASSVHDREFAGLPRFGGPESPPPTVAPPSGAPQAGWLPDPSGDPGVIRYWDGTAWTIHTAQRIR